MHIHAAPLSAAKPEKMCMLLQNNHNKKNVQGCKNLYGMYVTSAERAPPPRLLSNSPAEGDKRPCSLRRLSY